MLLAAVALAGCNEPQESGRETLEQQADEDNRWPEVQVEDEDEVDVGGGEVERLEPDVVPGDPEQEPPEVE